MTQVTNAALKDLAFLPGKWEMTLLNAPFLGDSSKSVKSEVQFDWIENGAFIAMCQGTDASWVIGIDGDKSEYKVIYFDSRNVSRIYEMSFENNTWKMWRSTPEFSQRYEAKVSSDHRIITSHWEKSFDSRKTWEHDFDMKFTKI